MRIDKKSGVGKRIQRILLVLLVLIILLSGLTWVAGTFAKTQLVKEQPAPGQLIDVGGYKLHINCQGQGYPTVLLEAGNNDFSVIWSTVQPEIARFTRVCAYDRAGFGWSEKSPHPRTVETMVGELHTLLMHANIEGPYVMVGHSFGGIIVRSFARRYPDLVSGIVLVDSAHEEQAIRVPALAMAARQITGQFRVLSAMNRLGLLALSPEQIPDRGLKGDALNQYRAVLATTDYFDAAAIESETIYADMVKEPGIKLSPLKVLPLIVLSRGMPEPLPGASALENQQYEFTWKDMQKELLGLSSTSEQEIAVNSGHYIQLQQPDLVIGAVREILDSYH